MKLTRENGKNRVQQVSQVCKHAHGQVYLKQTEQTATWYYVPRWLFIISYPVPPPKIIIP